MIAQSTLLLASQSPRRQELLRQIGVDYECINVDIDESVRDGELADAYVSRLATEKAWAAWSNQTVSNCKAVLAADTAVVLDGTIMGKPRDQQDALAMLMQLSGRTHQVYSGVALVDGETNLRLSCSQVTFRTISHEEAWAYWQTGEPTDKAGGYAIQGLGALFISNLNGSYSGVMGLPLFETSSLLYEAGFPLLGIE